MLVVTVYLPRCVIFTLRFEKELSVCQILSMSMLGEVSLVESNEAAGFTPGGALPSVPLSVSFAAVLPPESDDFGFLDAVPAEQITTLGNFTFYIHNRRVLLTYLQAHPLWFVHAPCGALLVCM